MPFFSGTKQSQSLLARGAKYRVLFSFKQDSSHQVFKAVKKSAGIQQETLLKVFLREKRSYREEFESLSRVASPYCARLLGFEDFGKKKALVLEYIKGVSLFQLAENFSLTPGEINHILFSIYKGLEDLNKQGLSHGDLSLSNVLVNEKGYIKLIDFGKANYESAAQGTAPFMAPEILKGARANFLSDLYSLGVIEAVLKTPYPLTFLKDMKREDFNSSSPLLSLDPARRIFQIKASGLPEKDLKFLSYKVRELMAVNESKHCPTLRKHQPLFLWAFAKLLPLILFFSVITSSASYLFPYGWVKVYTNEWFVVRVGQFESYTPRAFPLKSGWHFIQWKNKESQGKRKIFISKEKALFLNDKSFLY